MLREESISARLCERIWTECDVVRLCADDGPGSTQAVDQLARQMLSEERIILPKADEDQIVAEVVAATTGLGPLEPLLADPTISEIMVNGPDKVFVERRGELVQIDGRFEDDDHIRQVMDRILARAGRRVDALRPMADARLPDGSRVHAVIPPLAVDGPVLTIRRFLTVARTMDDLEAHGAFPTPQLREQLEQLVTSHANVVVSGPTSSGKTTLLAAALSLCDPRERIVIIEDSAELPLQHPHQVRLETRPATFEAAGEVQLRDLVRGALRMRPDRIIVGEVRGAESFDMVQAMHTGHRGCWSTVHANTPADALERIVTMSMFANVGVPHDVLALTVGRAIDAVVQVGREPHTGRRMVQSIGLVSRGPAGWKINGS